MQSDKRALIILTAYDFESLQLTLKSLDYTLEDNETVVIILNGINSNASAIVERIARNWASKFQLFRHVVRPICSGAKAFFAIKEILTNYGPLKDVQYICKIDDDIIPLRKNWLGDLSEEFIRTAKKCRLGYMTGLINNNCWGFNELLDLFQKREEFKSMFNYHLRGSIANRNSDIPVVNSGAYGTIWQEPFIAWWTHQWTSLRINDFISVTAGLENVEIPRDIAYSIGCIFFERQLWLGLEHDDYNSLLDEEILHMHCSANEKIKVAVMRQPMIHLFYFNQRLANRDILDEIGVSLSAFFKDETFHTIRKMTLEELTINLKEEIKELNNGMMAFFKSVTAEEE